LVIAAFFPIAPFAGHNDVTRQMKSQPKAVQGVQMLDRRPILFQWPQTVTAVVLKFGGDGVSVCAIRNVLTKLSADFSAKAMQEHTDELIRHIGFGP
jgi:hypothetical protein